MPYLGNVLTSFNVGTNNINNEAITSEKIAAGAVVNADVNDTASIAGTKISADFGAQDLIVDTNLLFVDVSTDRVGVGTTSPSRPLTLQSDSSTAFAIQADSDTTLRLQMGYDYTNDYARIASEDVGADQKDIFQHALNHRWGRNNSTEYMRLDSSGRVGIGTNTITEKLTLVSNNDTSAVDNGLGIYRSTGDDKVTINCQGGAARFIADGGSGYIPFRFVRYNGTTLVEDLHISSSGDIGIGTTSPAALLHLADNNPHIRLEDENDNQDWEIVGSDLFRIRDITNSSADRFVIDGSGNVGIGQTVPQNQLSMGSTGSFHTDANSFYLGSNFTGTGQNYIASSKHAQRLFFNNASSNGYLSYSNTGGTGTAGNAITWQERFRVDSSGRLSVGVSNFAGNANVAIRGDVNSDTNGGRLAFVNSTTIASGSRLGLIEFGNQNGNTGAMIGAYGDGDWAANDYPGFIGFFTTGDGNSSVTERLRITQNGTVQLRNSPGIDFSQIQTNAGGMTSETLDSYEEGTWTPSLSFGSGSTGLTYGTQQGSYTKIGRTVYCQFNIILTNRGSSTGGARLEGLPFTVGDRLGGTSYEPGGFFTLSLNMAGTLTGPYAVNPSHNSTFADIQGGSGNEYGIGLNQGNFDNNASTRGFVIYNV